MLISTMMNPSPNPRKYAMKPQRPGIAKSARRVRRRGGTMRRSDSTTAKRSVMARTSGAVDLLGGERRQLQDDGHERVPLGARQNDDVPRGVGDTTARKRFLEQGHDTQGVTGRVLRVKLPVELPHDDVEDAPGLQVGEIVLDRLYRVEIALRQDIGTRSERGQRVHL